MLSVQFRLCVAVLLLSLVSSTSFGASASSYFDQGTEGWLVVDLANLGNDLGNPPQVIAVLSPTWCSDGGNPGGYIRQSDPSANWCMFAAPDEFLGDQSSMVGQALQFDLFVDRSDGTPWPLVVLVGGGKTLYYDTAPPLSNWTHYVVGFTPEGWRVNSRTGAFASPADIEQVLGDITALYIEEDWFTGDETAGLDNVEFVPEPASGAALVLGLAAVACGRRRKAPVA